MPRERIELSWPCGQLVLSQPRIPVPPPRHKAPAGIAPRRRTLRVPYGASPRMEVLFPVCLRRNVGATNRNPVGKRRQEARRGFAPLNNGFADRRVCYFATAPLFAGGTDLSVSTSPRRQNFVRDRAMPYCLATVPCASKYQKILQNSTTPPPSRQAVFLSAPFAFRPGPSQRLCAAPDACGVFGSA